MIYVMTALFLLGYLAIAMEGKLQISKTATALITAIILWVIYITMMPLSVTESDPAGFSRFLYGDPAIKSLPLLQQCINYIVNVQIIENLGEISETLFFLLGAMTIVEIIDVHGGFSLITNKITTRHKRRLLWIISGITFLMSAILDNMTTSIVMVMLIRRIIPNYKERWIFASIIIIAANSGGAWSPIGDVTTIMLWVKGNISAVPLISSLLLPCIVSVLVPVSIAARMLHGDIIPNDTIDKVSTNIEQQITIRERRIIFILGVGFLIAVPIFKGITHLPPYMGVLMGLSIVWIYTDFMYQQKIDIQERFKHRVTQVLSRIDTSTILFFLGILMAVGALSASGILDKAALILSEKVHNIYIINTVIGMLSSVVDNVPLVAAAIGMYPVADPATLNTLADPAFMSYFMVDGAFWVFLAYCAGVGGSILIIGSVAGVVTMGIEKINFTWYLKYISPLALLGYFAGVLVYILQSYIISGSL